MALQKQNRIAALSSIQTRRLDKPSNRLVTLKQSEDWKQLPRSVQRSFEANEARSLAITHALERHGEAVGDLRAENHESILASAREWNALIYGLGDTISDEEREALFTQKTNEFVSLLIAHQDGLDTLKELLGTSYLEILTRPNHEWVKPSWGDVTEDLVTFGEAELIRRGHPPLTFWESVANTVTFGMVADMRLREYERARVQGQGQPVGQEAHLEQGVIDVPFSPR